MSFLLSIKGNCQPGNWLWGFYSKKQLSNELRNKAFKVKEKNNRLGIMINDTWYRISNKPTNSTNELYWIIGTPDNISDTINVYTNNTETEFKLILTPNLKKEFQKTIVRKYRNHISHASHYSSSK